MMVMRRWWTSLLIVAFGSLCWAGSPAWAKAKTSTELGSVAKAERSWRFVTKHGVLRVWRPKAYDRRTAGVVIYVHGFGVDVDAAWTAHKLAKKFRDSRQNALFIVPEAPTDLQKPVLWTSVSRLIGTSLRLTKQKWPRGQIVVLGHSGAYLTILPWLRDRNLNHIVLLDGLYACEPQFEHWLYRSKSHTQNHLVLVAADTVRWADPMVKRSTGVLALAKIPASYSAFSKNARRAKLLYMRSQYEHMALVTRDDIVPLLLRLAPLKRL